MCTVHDHISTHTHLRVMKIKRHLLCWHLLQSHTPPPLPHPSCHNCKNSTNTHAHSCIFTLTHTHHFSCSHLFPLATTLFSWCSCAHSWSHVKCVRVHMWTRRLFVTVVPAEHRYDFTHHCFCKAKGISLTVVLNLTCWLQACHSNQEINPKHLQRVPEPLNCLLVWFRLLTWQC